MKTKTKFAAIALALMAGLANVLMLDLWSAISTMA